MPSRIRPKAASSADRKSRRKMSSLAKLAFLASCCIYQISVQAESQHSTIPRSNNRYSHYTTDPTDPTSTNGSSSNSNPTGLDTLSSPSSPLTYHPPWNPSPKIDPSGFLSETYARLPGEWEPLANIRGKHGPRNPRRYEQLLERPMQIRQVPGDGNCLFHSIAACLHYEQHDGKQHLPMDSYDCIGALRSRSLQIRNNAVDVLQNVEKNGRRKLFLQGEEYLEAHELLGAAAAQFDLEGGEYCELMRKESYWGGGPEIVALCNYLQRPIHIYELIPADEASHNQANNNSRNQGCNAKKISTQFTLRRMACFGSPKFDRREPLHILSADSRFPDIEPRRIRKVGNHFLALFPVKNIGNAVGNGEGDDNHGQTNRFRRHALIRGGSRILDGVGKDATTNRSNKSNGSSKKKRDNGSGGSGDNGRMTNSSEIRERIEKWDGGQGSWKSMKVERNTEEFWEI